MIQKSPLEKFNESVKISASLKEEASALPRLVVSNPSHAGFDKSLETDTESSDGFESKLKRSLIESWQFSEVITWFHTFVSPPLSNLST